MKAVALFILWLSMAGCSLLPTRTTKAPTATINLPSGSSVTQTGDAQKPASVATSVTTSILPVPASSTVTVDEKKPGVLTFALAAASELKTETKTEKAEAPQAFAPPAPPTVSDMADARARLWYRVGLAAGTAAALFGLVRGWDLVMYGGGTVAAACAFAIFIQTNPLVFVVIGLGVAAAFLGPWFWHLFHKDNPAVNPTASP